MSKSFHKLMYELEVFKELIEDGWNKVVVGGICTGMEKKDAEGNSVTMEFCIGDICVGAWKENLDWHEPKRRTFSLEEALREARNLESKYLKS